MIYKFEYRENIHYIMTKLIAENPRYEVKDTIINMVLTTTFPERMEGVSARVSLPSPLVTSLLPRLRCYLTEQLSVTASSLS